MARYLVDHNGIWWTVLPGTDHSDDAVGEAAVEVGSGEPITKIEYLTYQPRVKWCGNYGDPCDFEGEWHGHWHGVRESPTSAYTLVRGGAS